MAFHRSLLVAVAVSGVLGGVAPAVARPTPAPSPAAAATDGTGDLPPLPYTGPFASRHGNLVVFFSAVPLGGSMAEVRKRHPEMAFERTVTDWIAMRPIGKQALTLVAGTGQSDRIGMLNIANLKLDKVPALLAHLTRQLGKPVKDVQPIGEFYFWENSAVRKAGDMPPNTRLVLSVDKEDETVQCMAFFVDPQGKLVAP